MKHGNATLTPVHALLTGRVQDSFGGLRAVLFYFLAADPGSSRAEFKIKLSSDVT
jgi:hypothetical protein